MKLGLVCLLLVGCGCPYEAATADAGPVEQPTIFCDNVGACTSGWTNGHAIKCTGRLNEDSGGCVLVPGAGPDAGWYYCCPF